MDIRFPFYKQYFFRKIAWLYTIYQKFHLKVYKVFGLHLFQKNFQKILGYELINTSHIFKNNNNLQNSKINWEKLKRGRMVNFSIAIELEKKVFFLFKIFRNYFLNCRKKIWAKKGRNLSPEIDLKIMWHLLGNFPAFSAFIKIKNLSNCIETSPFEKPFFLLFQEKNYRFFKFLIPRLKLKEIPIFFSLKFAKKILTIVLRFCLSLSPGLKKFFKKEDRSLISSTEDLISFLTLIFWKNFFFEFEHLPHFFNIWDLFRLRKKWGKTLFSGQKKSLYQDQKKLFYTRRKVLLSLKNSKNFFFCVLKKNWLNEAFSKYFLFPKTKIFRKFLENFYHLSNIIWEISKLEWVLHKAKTSNNFNPKDEKCSIKKNLFYGKMKFFHFIQTLKIIIFRQINLIDFEISFIKKKDNRNPKLNFDSYKNLLRNFRENSFGNIKDTNKCVGFFRNFLPIFQFILRFIWFLDGFEDRILIKEPSVFFPHNFQKFCKNFNLINIKFEERSVSLIIITHYLRSNIIFSSQQNPVFYFSRKNFL